MSKESKKACRNCIHKDVCRWFPKAPRDFVITEGKYINALHFVTREGKQIDALQSALEKLFATYCAWYDK